MSFTDYALARQYLVEHRIGTRIREAQSKETAIAKRSSQAIERSK